MCVSLCASTCVCVRVSVSLYACVYANVSLYACGQVTIISLIIQILPTFFSMNVAAPNQPQRESCMAHIQPAQLLKLIGLFHRFEDREVQRGR